jgi:superfamily II DNA or RNA helicase
VPYFKDNRHLLNLKLETKTLDGLRECQLGAYWAVLAHFTADTSPALVSLPTGSGKTALMQILSFGLEAKRVLVIEPSTILRDQVEAEFRTFSRLKQIGVVSKHFSSPRSLFREGRVNRRAEWEKFRKYDVVVATPHTTSPEQPGVVKPPDGLFDVVFIDEAHHAPAPTWAALLSAFEQSRCVLLTATPFRRDRRRLQAHLIYSYPIARALENEIYRPIKYHPVSVTTPGELDDALSKAAKRVLTAEEKLGNKSRLLVRTERVGNAASLIKLYKDHGINLGEVDYTRSLASNQQTLDDVRQAKLDGIVCVGMVGEGLDLPVLKIAVLHHSPRSLPFTLQFIGRVARFAPAQVGDAHLVASPDEVRGEVRKLYREDADWRKLIPDLVDNVLGEVAKLRHFRSTSPLGYLDINPMDLKPFHSVRVYGAKPSQVNIETELNFEGEMQICFAEVDSTGRVLTVITETERTPPWAKETAITQTEYDLHIYYHSRSACGFR